MRRSVDGERDRVAVADGAGATAALDDADADRLRRARRVARLLDEAVEIPVIRRRVGVDAVAGLVPVVGDFLAALLSLVVVWEAFRLGARRRTLARMLLYVVVDFFVGSVPVVGDLLDAAVKLNLRNVRLLERELARRAR